MLSDTYVFTVKGDSNDTLHMVRPRIPVPVGWIPPALVLMAAKGSGGHRLYYICGTNPYKRDKPCSEYPMEVDEVWASVNAGTLKRINVCDAASDLIRENVIAVDVIDETTGRIDYAASARQQSREYSRYVVTVTCHGETCDGHATKLGIVTSEKEAQYLIEEDKGVFLAGVGEDNVDDVVEKTNEIWYGTVGENGRTYDVIEI